MNAFTIIAGCLVSSAVIQVTAYYIYTSVYIRRFKRNAAEMQPVSRLASLSGAAVHDKAGKLQPVHSKLKSATLKQQSASTNAGPQPTHVPAKVIQATQKTSHKSGK